MTKELGMKYKMVCIDMDGTLLGKRKKISDFSKDAGTGITYTHQIK